MNKLIYKIRAWRYPSSRSGKCQGVDYIEGIKLRCASLAFCCPSHTTGDISYDTTCSRFAIGCPRKEGAVFEKLTIPTPEELELERRYRNLTSAEYEVRCFLREIIEQNQPPEKKKVEEDMHKG